jgi:hypothetical protein
MKNFILLLNCLAFTGIINAQTLYVKNTTSVNNLDVTNILKLTSSCSSTNYCMMTNITGVPSGGSTSQGYPTPCARSPNIILSITLSGVGTVSNIQYCGTNVTGSIGTWTYDLYPTGVGTEMLIYVH